MKTRISLFSLAITSLAYAQPSGKMYALTAEKKGATLWNQIQLIDVAKSNNDKLIYNASNVKYQVSNVEQISLNASRSQSSIGQKMERQAVPSGSASLAYDKVNGKLFFAPMFQNGVIHYINVNDKKPTIQQIFFTVKSTNVADREGSNLTRMVIGADGKGYALSNDANTFLKFSTNKKSAVEDLGGLIDDASNGDISIHNKCSSWGGDMIADAWGNLYVITMYQNVFKINPTSRVATYMGHIQGLADQFTCNGAAVSENGEIILSGAVYTKGYFALDLKKMQAKPFGANNDGFNASDLASGNLYGENEINNSLTTMATIPTKEIYNNNINIYPNPVTNNQINISFDKLTGGVYNIELMSAASKPVLQQQISANQKGKSFTINIDKQIPRGIYIIKVTDVNHKLMMVDKLLLQ